MAGEWQTVAGLMTGTLLTLLGTRRQAAAIEKSAATAASASLQSSARTAEASLAAKNIEYLFSELRDVREREKELRGLVATQTREIDALRNEVRILQQTNQTLTLEHERELRHREMEIERLHEALIQKETQRKEIQKKE